VGIDVFALSDLDGLQKGLAEVGEDGWQASLGLILPWAA
jgi:hypothetical protein